MIQVVTSKLSWAPMGEYGHISLNQVESILSEGMHQKIRNQMPKDPSTTPILNIHLFAFK
jgi:hypothetical protein